ncbi:PREDICTED: uncharacterized protein LOC106101322 [Papilio polytes]|uniref:uncharacterized protein LOC106101322 n=1 Tax=Papilio polytes TaxID=76194 RepID=UPI00067636AC|nr:PREDICTED: uncharacterized protein LOC106101322 [Papilio polytes]
MNENMPLLLSNVKIVNASVTANPVDHIQRMIVPNSIPEMATPHQLQLMPWVPLELWVQGKSDNDLVILQVNSSKPIWTMNGGQSIVTLTDYACDTPVYCSLPIQDKTRIIFPEENNGTAVYNPPTLQIYEESANGNTPFAKWVNSVVNNKNINNSTYVNDKEMTQETTSRIKVKSFAKITKIPDNFVAPSRVCLQDRLYVKVSDQPLKYAKVITALSSLDEFHNLVLEDAPLKLLPKDVIHYDSLQSLNNLKNSFIWPLSRHKC